VKTANRFEGFMHLVELVAILAVFQYVAFGFLAGRERARSGLKAPAMTGHDGFERMYRVQTNTMETLVALLPFLFLSAQYWPAYVVAGLGLVYFVGRLIYWRSYVNNPSTRTLGFALSIAPTIILGLLGLVGVLRAMV
jgi:glutathione S-transferase